MNKREYTKIMNALNKAYIAIETYEEDDIHFDLKIWETQRAIKDLVERIKAEHCQIEPPKL